MKRWIPDRILTTIITSGVIALTSSPAAAACPSAGDLLYTVRDGDTLSDLAASAYAYDRPEANRIVWELIYSYNRNEVGAEPEKIPTGTGVCFPARLHYDDVVATRRATFLAQGAAPAPSPDVMASSSAPPETAAGKAAASDVEKAPTPPAPAPTGPAPTATASTTPSPRSPPRAREQRTSVEVGGGILVPPSSYTHKYLFRELGTSFVGARRSVGRAEIAARLLFAYGNHGTVYNEADQQQDVRGLGGAFQVAIPFEVAAFRVSPSATMDLLYVERSFTHTDFPLKGQDVKQSGLLPMLGLSVRGEWTPHPVLSFAPERLAVAAEAGGDVMLAAPSEYDLGEAVVLQLTISVLYRVF